MEIINSVMEHLQHMPKKKYHNPVKPAVTITVRIQLKIQIHQQVSCVQHGLSINSIHVVLFSKSIKVIHLHIVIMYILDITLLKADNFMEFIRNFEIPNLKTSYKITKNPTK